MAGRNGICDFSFVLSPEKTNFNSKPNDKKKIKTQMEKLN